MTTTYKGFTLSVMKYTKPDDGLYAICRGEKEVDVIEKTPSGRYAIYRGAIYIQFPNKADRLARSEREGDTPEELFTRWVDEYHERMTPPATPRVRTPNWEKMKAALAAANG